MSMTLKGIRKLQTAAVILYGAAFLLSLIIVLFQRPFVSIYTSDPGALALQVFPWTSFIPLLVSLLAAVLFLVLCLSLKTAKGSRVSVIILMIALYVFRYLITPTVTSVYQLALNQYGTSYIVSFSAVTHAVSLFTSPLSLAGGLLMLLAMGGFYGYNPSEPEGRNAMTLKGARIIQAIAVCLLGLALLLCLALTVCQNTVQRLFGAPDEISRLRVVPWDILIHLALISVPAVIWLIGLLKGKGNTRGIVILTAILIGVFSLICLIIPTVIAIIYSRFYSINTMAAYSSLQGAVAMLTNPLSGAAFMLTLFSLGGFFGKERPGAV